MSEIGNILSGLGASLMGSRQQPALSPSLAQGDTGAADHYRSGSGCSDTAGALRRSSLWVEIAILDRAGGFWPRALVIG